MLKVAISLFLTGMTLGLGPCLASCGPVLVSYIAGTKDNVAGGLRTYIIFSLGRLFVYISLGTISGIFGQIFANVFYDSKLAVYIWVIGGLFVSLLGVATIIGFIPKWPFSKKVSSLTLGNDAKSVFLLGIFVGLSPCGPLLGILSYIALVSKTILHGLFYSFAFGIGSFISPLIILAAFSGFIPSRLARYPAILKYFRIIAGAVLVYLGIGLLFSPWLKG